MDSWEYQVTFRQQWRDSRLAFDDQRGAINFLTLATGEKQVWTPDTFIRNELEAKVHNALTPNEYVRVFPNGDVLHSVRLTLKTTCRPDADATYGLVCPIQIASYAWTMADLEYVWKEVAPMQIVNDGMLATGFDMTQHNSMYCNVKTATGEYSCLNAEFKFAPVKGVVA